MSSKKDALFFIFSFVVLVTLFSPSFFATSTTGLILFILTCGAYRTECKQFFVENKYSFLLLFLGLLIGIVFSELPSKSVKGSYDFLRGILLVFPAHVCARKYCSNKLKFEKIIIVLALCACLLLLLFPLTFFSQDHSMTLQRYIYTISETYFGNVHNLINGVVVLFFMFICLLLWGRLSGIWRCLSVGAAIWTFTFLIICESEGTYIGFLLCLFVYLFIFKPSWRKWLVVPFLCFFGAFFSLFIFPDFYQHNFAISLGGYMARSHIYGVLVEAIIESPITGYGINTYKYLIAAQPKGLGHLFIHPHQNILELLFSVGFLGTAFILLSLFFFLRNAVYLNHKKNVIRMFGFLLFIYLVGKGLTDAKLFSFYFGGLLSMALGLLSFGEKIKST